jgi:3-phytase
MVNSVRLWRLPSHLAASLAAFAIAGSAWAADASTAAGPNPVVRFATFNASLNRGNAGDLIKDLSSPGNAQAAAVAEIIQRVRPDVLLINEFDFDADGVAARLFQENYLSVPQQGAQPIVYGYRFVAPSNTGIPTSFDLNNDSTVGGPNDAYGFGFFPGQFGMAVYSRYPIDHDRIRTFQTFLWKDMPGARLPTDPLDSDGDGDTSSFYSPAELEVVRLSSKSHWDVPISIEMPSGGVTKEPGGPGGSVARNVVHFLVSHPTPPVFDGPEDRNGTRNFDEIRFWADYIQPRKSGYIYDDRGVRGGLPAGALFVIAGDQNSDPNDGDSIPGAIQQLLEHPRINARVTPDSAGASEQASLQGGANATHLSDPAFDTADFADTTPGNLRADYVLPRRNMRISAAGVFWPTQDDPLFRLVGTFPFPTSDHRLVWIDVRLPSRSSD